MFEFAALTYGLLASFIMSATNRNRRERRRNPVVLALFATGLMAFSAAFAVLLFGWITVQALAGAPIAA
jgi:CHASE2 domain-containing sensor protein